MHTTSGPVPGRVIVHPLVTAGGGMPCRCLPHPSCPRPRGLRVLLTPGASAPWLSAAWRRRLWQCPLPGPAPNPPATDLAGGVSPAVPHGGLASVPFCHTVRSGPAIRGTRPAFPAASCRPMVPRSTTGVPSPSGRAADAPAGVLCLGRVPHGRCRPQRHSMAQGRRARGGRQLVGALDWPSA
jgi:hypothetical protein